MNSTALFQKLWNYYNVLRDDGMSYGDYVEQLTYLPFPKMVDARSCAAYNQPSAIPAAYAGPTLLGKGADRLLSVFKNLELGIDAGDKRAVSLQHACLENLDGARI